MYEPWTIGRCCPGTDVGVDSLTRKSRIPGRLVCNLYTGLLLARTFIVAINNQRWQTLLQVVRFASTGNRVRSLVTTVRTGVLAGILTISLSCLASAQSAEPSEIFTPEQVVRIVVESLKDNDEASDTGIATVFRFASPANKLSTGPLSRFTTMIKSGFPDMINHSSSRYDSMEIVGNTAIQAVWLMTTSGKELGYLFQLGRQVAGEYAGMWMTDMVVPLGEGPRSGTRI